jgi:hypothetical protein
VKLVKSPHVAGRILQVFKAKGNSPWPIFQLPPRTPYHPRTVQQRTSPPQRATTKPATISSSKIMLKFTAINNRGTEFEVFFVKFVRT